MPISTAVQGEPWRRRLYLPAYQVSDAARYARTSPQTVANWHYRNGDSVPVLPGKERRRPLSYLQLVEVAVVAVFRQFAVPLQSIRRAREYMAQNFNAEHPFAEYKFKTDGYHLLMNVREFEPEIQIPETLIVLDQGGQLGWERMMVDRLFEFDYEFDLALKWHVAGRQSPVLIDPRIAFGAPTVKGVATWILKGRSQAGESLADMTEDFGLTEDELQFGLEFEGIRSE